MLICFSFQTTVSNTNFKFCLSYLFIYLFLLKAFFFKLWAGGEIHWVVWELMWWLLCKLFLIIFNMDLSAMLLTAD